MIRNACYSLITQHHLISPSVFQLDLFSNSGRRGFCCSQPKARFSCATMHCLPLTSWCFCRAVVRPLWRARRSSTCPSCPLVAAGTVALPWSCPSTNTCCCWPKLLQTAGLSLTVLSLNDSLDTVSRSCSFLQYHSITICNMFLDMKGLITTASVSLVQFKK